MIKSVFWQRFLKNKMALAGSIIVIVIFRRLPAGALDRTL